MKKIFSLMLTVVLVAALFVGCGAKTYKDGSYKQEGEVDEHGWKPEINITVADGKITEVVYDEFSKDDNHKKSEDEAYKEAYAAKVPGADQKANYEKLAKDLVEKQDPSKVDTIAGATSTTNSFKELAKNALKQAK